MWRNLIIFICLVLWLLLVPHCCSNRLPETWWLNTNLLCYNSEVSSPKIKVSTGYIPFGGSTGEAVSLPFQLLESACTPCFLVPSSIFKAIRVVSWNLFLSFSLNFCCHISFSDCPVLMNLCDYCGFTWIIQNNP